MLTKWVNQLETAIRKYDLRVEETESYLKLYFQFGLESKASILEIIDSRPEGPVSKITIRHDEADEDLACLNLDETSLSEGDACSLLIIKNKEAPSFFVTSIGFEKSITRITKQNIVFLNSDVGFSSLSCKFLPVSEFELLPTGLTTPSDCEDSFATFLSGRVDTLADISIPFFVLKDTEESDSPFFVAWKKESCKNMILLTGNKIETIEGGDRQLIAKSEKKLTFTLGSIIDVDSFQALQELVRWLILPKRDAKVRHQIYVGCLTREGGDGTNLWDFFNSSSVHALEAAQLNYDSLLDKEARESLKVMIDIRKAIFDAASQISKDAQEISSRAAADIAAVVGLLIARVTLVAKGSIDVWIAKVILGAAILYLGYRIYSVLYISSEFFNSTDMARNAWNKRVYCNLNAKDREELSEQPIERAKNILLRSVDIAGVAYGVILFSLILALIF